MWATYECHFERRNKFLAARRECIIIGHVSRSLPPEKIDTRRRRWRAQAFVASDRAACHGAGNGDRDETEEARNIGELWTENIFLKLRDNVDATHSRDASKCKCYFFLSRIRSFHSLRLPSPTWDNGQERRESETRRCEALWDAIETEMGTSADGYMRCINFIFGQKCH